MESSRKEDMEGGRNATTRWQEGQGRSWGSETGWGAGAGQTQGRFHTL